MKNSKAILKLVVLAMLIALGVVISPILRVEGMCPMAHLKRQGRYDFSCKEDR